jgi:hypothetical protein
MARVTQIYKVRLFLDEVRKMSSCANQKPAEKVPARGKVRECGRQLTLHQEAEYMNATWEIRR